MPRAQALGVVVRTAEEAREDPGAARARTAVEVRAPAHRGRGRAIALVDPEALLADRRRVDRVLQPALAAFLAHALGRLVEPAEDARREQA